MSPSGYSQRFNTKIAFARKKIVGGTLGKIVSVMVSRHLSRSLGKKIASRTKLSPAAMESTHDLDFVFWMLEPAKPVRVYSQGAYGYMKAVNGSYDCMWNTVAAVFLRSFAKKIWMLVRGPSLAESMSQYLIDRIKAIDNIEVLTQTEIVALYGSREKQLERVRWRNNVTGEETEKPIRHVFCFIGAEPATGWLRDSGIALDGKNFVLTGSDVPSDARPSNNGSRRPLPLETSVRGVFASGDVRSGSVKRVGAAIGEGAVVGAELHVARADGAAESSGDAEKDSGTGSVGAMGMRLNPHCTPKRAHQEATAALSNGVAPAYSAAGWDRGR